jgi:hypothetical protein
MQKVPWLPGALVESATPEPCPRCARRAMVPWFLRRDRERLVWRTWICVNCQATEERPEPE